MKNRIVPLVVLLSLSPTAVLHSQTEWIQCADMPVATEHHATCYNHVNDRIYAFGGTPGGAIYHDIVLRYSPPGDTWISLAAMPDGISRIGASFIAWNEKICLLGGYNGSVQNNNS